MEYNYKEIEVGNVGIEKMREGINDLAEAVLVTMGPAGKTVIIPDKEGGHKVTKDGVSVARSIHFKDPLKNIGAELIKEVAENTVKEAGDGTTTSICLANALINEGIKQGLTNKYLYSALDGIEKYAIKELDKQATPLEKSDIKDVAIVSANGDKNIGELIERAFTHTDLVKIDYSNSENDEVVVVNGMELKTGIFDNAFINNPRHQAIDYNTCALLVVEGELGNVATINTISQKLEEGTPIVIIADDFQRPVLRVLKDAHNRGLLNIGLIKAPGYAEHRKNLISDIIKTICPVKVAAPNSKPIYWGMVDSIKANKYKTIISYKTNDDINKYKEELIKSLKHIKEDYSKELMQQRIDNLNGSLVNILVGGKSELEAKERFDRVEDAVLAVKCALDEGVIEGGGIPLYKIAKKIGEQNKLAQCLTAPRDQIESGHRTSLKADYSILDPVKVTKVALRNAISVAKTILGTEAVVL